jgi:hypothetical protein
MVSGSPYLQGLVGEANKDTGPEFNLWEWSGSAYEASGGTIAGGYTRFRDAEGNVIAEPGGDAAVATIDAVVSMGDLNNADVVEMIKAAGGNPTVGNTQAHEFGHGILAIQGYKSTEAQARKVECKVMKETGGSCTP